MTPDAVGDMPPTHERLKVIAVAGARPNFVKIAPLMRAFAGRPTIQALLVNTGQHYDFEMNRVFFEQMAIPTPDVDLEVGSHSHAVQTARIMERFEPVLEREQPDVVLVVGDVNSTIACALVAVKLGIPVAHVEAGLRSFDRTMPEEINRVLTDAISHLLFVTERSGIANLRREGVDERRIHFVGNVMIDALRQQEALAAASRVLERLEVRPGEYALLTLHRPANVDDPAVFGGICDALEQIAARQPIVFPVHPRTRANLRRNGLSTRLAALPSLRLVDPLGYLDNLKLMGSAAVVLTDSGGVQEETTVLGTPCLTLRDNTERPVTIEQGTNRLVGNRPERILAAYHEAIAAPHIARCPELWDGHAADRITEALLAADLPRRSRA
jgi:UDP-N-acetylglucosamine 2-epimerase (non-hydrolysing)